MQIHVCWLTFPARKRNLKIILFSGDDGLLADDQEIPIKVKEEAVATKTTWQIEHEQYLRLCRGDVERSPKVLAKLKCYLNFGEDPYLKLMPYKEEVVNLKPRISIFYDVLTETEIQTVKELATPRVCTGQHYFTYLVRIQDS